MDYTEPDSTDPSKYTWYRFKGLQGEWVRRELAGKIQKVVQMGKHHTCTLNTPMMAVRHSHQILEKQPGITLDSVRTLIGRILLRWELIHGVRSKAKQERKAKKGDKGATGATGPQGPQGVKGDTGATGPQGVKKVIQDHKGPQGPQGQTGDAGKDGQMLYATCDTAGEP